MTANKLPHLSSSELNNFNFFGNSRYMALVLNFCVMMKFLEDGVEISSEENEVDPICISKLN